MPTSTSTSKRMRELASRKSLLQQRSAMLRHTLAVQLSEHLTPALGLADRAVASGQWLKRHPVLLVGVAAALLVWRPKAGLKGLLHGASRGMWLWQTWLKVQPVVMRLMTPSAAAAQSAQAPSSGH